MKYQINLIDKNNIKIGDFNNCSIVTDVAPTDEKYLAVTQEKGAKTLFKFFVYNINLFWRGIRICGFDDLSERYINIWAVVTKTNEEEDKES